MSSGQIFQSLRRLVCFAAVADAGSIKGAASRLGLSVPVISTALSELEQELAVRLAVRTTRKLALTKAGELVYQHAKAMLVSAESALDVAAEDRVMDGELKITVPVELSSHWLPEKLLPFYKRHPGIDLQIDAEDSVIPLHNSTYDIAIQANYQSPHDPSPQKSLKRKRKLGSLKLVCVSAAKSRAIWSENVCQLSKPLIEQNDRGDSIAALDTKTQRAVSLRGSNVIRTNNHEAALALVRSGLGAVLVMEDSVRQDLLDKTLYKVLPGFDFGHVNLELKVRDSLPSPAARAFVKFITQVKV